MDILYQKQNGGSNGYAIFFKKGAPYIPMSKGRGFTARSGKFAYTKSNRAPKDGDCNGSTKEENVVILVN